MVRSVSRILLLLASAGCSMFLAGCSGGDLGKTVDKPPSLQDRIAKIQNNPNLPPQAKQMQIQLLEQSQAYGVASHRGKLAADVPGKR